MKWLQFILSHSIFIAFCAAALAFQTVQLLQVHADIFLYGFIFFSTLCSYNFYWLVSLYFFRGHASGIHVFLRKELGKIILFSLSGTGLVICFFYSSLTINNIIPALLLTVIYAIPLLPFKFTQFVRKAGVLKTVLLAFTWSYVTAYLPLQKSFLLLNNADLFIISRRFLFMLMLCIIFDSRDMSVDKIRGLRSLATDLGPKTLRFFIGVIFLVLFATNFLSLNYGISINQSIALQVSTLALLIAWYFSTKKQGYFFYYFFIDGLMLFSALTTYIASI